jgi:translation initiation factor IF-1
MQKKKVEGRVLEALPDCTFLVELNDGRKVLAYLSGRMRLYYIKVIPGDRVLVELSPYDETKGRIIQRLS